jgi:hypothetical protein
MFFTFIQNNTGGRFHHDRHRGIAHIVIIEARSRADALSKADELGIYFNGVEDGMDCQCCGDRWYSSSDRPTNYPHVYSKPVTDLPNDDMFFGPWDSIVIHFADGTVTWR